jgi:hypothetical protein
MSSAVSYPRRLSSPRSLGFLSPNSDSFVVMPHQIRLSGIAQFVGFSKRLGISRRT